jgi:hypothetical protein
MPLLVDARRVREVIGMSLTNRRTLTRRRAIRPARVGTTGLGNGALVKVQTAFGMAIATAMTKSDRGARVKYLVRVIATVEKTSDDDVLLWLRGPTDMCQEELVSAWTTRAEPLPDTAFVKDAVKRLRAVYDLLRRSINWDTITAA